MVGDETLDYWTYIDKLIKERQSLEEEESLIDLTDTPYECALRDNNQQADVPVNLLRSAIPLRASDWQMGEDGVMRRIQQGE